jgi:hypothetical protein
MISVHHIDVAIRPLVFVCQDAYMTANVAERLIDHQRGVRYGEVLPVFATADGFEAHIYGTQMLNDCPDELWSKLDAEAIAAEMGAVIVKLNGPRHWMLDGLGTKLAPVEPVMREFNGLMTRRIAVVPLGAVPVAPPYTEIRVDRRAVFFFDAGKPVYELVDPSGRAFVMQAYCIGVDPTLTEEELVGLGARLALPEGWSYRQRVLDEELVIDTTTDLATVLQDELENTYTLPS